ncbi:MFS transporter [Oxyplasma meridianum]|uniref:MFS transporter n=1 Tax=Oxyplasma meridianum TaxID=3073602 RepID=A0AAX4NIM4_9ARCH
MAEHRNLVLASVLIGMLMSAIDTTIVLLALPTITDELHAPFLDTIWVILIYLLILAALTTQLGRLGDVYGRGRLFNLGFLVFIIGSAASGFAPDVFFLIGARGFQGFGAALLQANSNAIVADHFPPQDRGKAFGITSMGWTIGGSLGIVLGGIITTFIGWRFIFYINIPIGIIGFLFALKYIRDDKRTGTTIDYPGTAILITLLSLISYGAVEIAGNGVQALNLSLVIVGIAMLIPFVLVERRVRDPLIVLKAFKERILTFSLLAATLQAVGYLSVLFILIMYLQGVRGFSPLDSSLLLVPGYIISSLFAPKMGKLSDKFGPRVMASTGIFMMAAGILIYLLMGVRSTLYLVIAGSIVTGFGGAMFWPSNNSAVMSGAPRELYGSISGLLRTLSNIGTLFSYVIAISIAALSVPRYVTFEVFLGTTKLQGGVSTKFLIGIHAALIASFAILIVAGLSSLVKSRNPGTVKNEEITKAWNQGKR